MDQDIDKSVLMIAKEIQTYLEKHPHAADSAEGVMRWWLSKQRFEESVQLVQQALELLVREGTVDKLLTPGGRAIYSNLEKNDSEQQH